MIGTWGLRAIFWVFCTVGGETEPSPRPAPSSAIPEAVAEMQKVLSVVRGHPFRSGVPVATLTEPEVRAFLLEKLQRDYPDAKIAQEQKAYVHFGFLEPGEDLKTLFVQMLVEQAAGFYDPDDKRLFLVAGRPLPGIALVHELAHALQDQTFGVMRIIDRARDDDDALLAVQAMIEGEAMSLASSYLSMGSAGGDLLDAEAAAGQSGEVEDSLEKLARMPDILQESLMFPYTQGMTWAKAVVRIGGQQMMDEMFRHPPDSSEQILHPEKTRTPRDLPSIIDRAALSGLRRQVSEAGYDSVKINTMGEFTIRQLFGGRGDRKAESVAGGWDGDLFEIVEKPGVGTAMIWITVWDSAGDATEFRERAGEWLAGRHKETGGFLVGSGGASGRVVWLMEGFDSSLMTRLEKTLRVGLREGVRLR